ncbi:helix-turn-helix transcriptional regulator [Cellulosimicrobium cellulans]|uniref:helix-turn-helix transcriptional regulator n=1 Tax=Cellulosimicrobium cellulans TaxID=1710 RepID=UPI003801280F
MEHIWNRSRAPEARCAASGTAQADAVDHIAFVTSTDADDPPRAAAPSHRRRARHGYQEQHSGYREFDDFLLDTAALADYLGVSKRTVANWRTASRDQDDPRFNRIGALVRYRKSDVHAWLAEMVA